VAIQDSRGPPWKQATSNARTCEFEVRSNAQDAAMPMPVLDLYFLRRVRPGPRGLPITNKCEGPFPRALALGCWLSRAHQPAGEALARPRTTARSRGRASKGKQSGRCTPKTPDTRHTGWS
jgi:hypothetical protein